MANYELQNDEVVLYEGRVISNSYKGDMISNLLNSEILLTLTSKKVIFEKEKGLLKKERELIDTVLLENIKVYNEMPQVKQNRSDVEIQSVEKNITITFMNASEARKFTGKIVDASTGTTIAKRGSEKIKSAFNMVDDTLGLDTRGTIKGVLENGVKGTILNGIGKRK